MGYPLSEDRDWTRRQPHHSCGSLSSPCKTLGITGTGWAPRARSLSPVAEQLMAEWRLELGDSDPLFLLSCYYSSWGGGGKFQVGLKGSPLTKQEMLWWWGAGVVRSENWEGAKLKPPSEWIIFRKNLLYISTTFLSGRFQLQRLIGLRTWSYSKASKVKMRKLFTFSVVAYYNRVFQVSREWWKVILSYHFREMT